MENNSSKCKGYKANLAEKNEDDNLYHAIGSADINESEILSCYIDTDVNESK